MFGPETASAPSSGGLGGITRPAEPHHAIPRVAGAERRVHATALTWSLTCRPTWPAYASPRGDHARSGSCCASTQSRPSQGRSFRTAAGTPRSPLLARHLASRSVCSSPRRPRCRHLASTQTAPRCHHLRERNRRRAERVVSMHLNTSHACAVRGSMRMHEYGRSASCAYSAGHACRHP